MSELKIGSMLAEWPAMVEYAGAMPIGLSGYPVPEEARRQMEAEAKARREKEKKMRRAAMVVDLAQEIYLNDAKNRVPAEAALQDAEDFIRLAEAYLAEKGE